MTSTDSTSKHDRALAAAFRLGYQAGLEDGQRGRSGGLLELVSDGQPHVVATCKDEQHPGCWRILAWRETQQQ